MRADFKFIRKLKGLHDQIDPAQATVQGVDGAAKGLMELIKTLKATRSQLFSLTAQKIPHGHGCGLPCLRYANFEFSCATHCRMKSSATR